MLIKELFEDDSWNQVQSFLRSLTPDDVGVDTVGPYRIHYEGFSDWCQQDAQERCSLPKTDPRHLSSYDDVYDEVLRDFIGRENGKKPLDSGLVGDEDYPIFYAVFKSTVAEAFDKPYKGKWEKSDFGDQDMLVKLPDGTNLSIMFNHEGDDVWQVEFWRGASQDVTGEGDAQRIFATVIAAIQKFIMKQQPWRIIFSASKDVEPGKNPESRAKLYNSLIARYARDWGYDTHNKDHGDKVTYELTRVDDDTVTEGPTWNKIKRTAATGAIATGLGYAALTGQMKDKPQQPAVEPAAVTQVQPEVEKPAEPEQQKVEKPAEKPMPSTATNADPAMEKLIFVTAWRSGLRGHELAQFMAQTAHETLGFTQLVEQGDKDYFKKYDPKHNPKKAKILGNAKPGDGAKYKGRGFLQITGRDIYRKAGQALKLPLEQKPELVSQPEIAAKVAVWFWQNRVSPKIEDFTDTIGVTTRVNPSMNGLGDRDLNYHSYVRRMKSILDKG